MFLKILLPIYIVTFLLSCQKIPLRGHVNMTKDYHSMVYLIDPINFNSLVSSFEGKILDSAQIDRNGQFEFIKMPLHEASKMYLLTIKKTNEIYANKLENENINMSNYIPFIYRNTGKIIIKTNAQHFLKDVEISGNIQENKTIESLIKSRYQLSEKYLNHQQDVDESNLIAHEKDLFQYQNAIFQTIKTNTDALTNALVLRWISLNGDYERIPELVNYMCQKLQSSSPDHLWTKQICAKSLNLPPTEGDIFPNFDLPMMQGDTIKLYSILGKKLTLVDLWASWCAPCRSENKNTLVPLWDQYLNQGLQIVGYALDSSDKGWKMAVEKDGCIRWHHASHLQGDISPIFEKLKISTIPANYILDEKGTILAKNLHGEDLNNWVAQYFKN